MRSRFTGTKYTTPTDGLFDFGVPYTDEHEHTAAVVPDRRAARGTFYGFSSRLSVTGQEHRLAQSRGDNQRRLCVTNKFRDFPLASSNVGTAPEAPGYHLIPIRCCGPFAQPPPPEPTCRSPTWSTQPDGRTTSRSTGVVQGIRRWLAFRKSTAKNILDRKLYRVRSRLTTGRPPSAERLAGRGNIFAPTQFAETAIPMAWLGIKGRPRWGSNTASG